MWIKVSRIILRNKFLLLGILLTVTIFFGYHARHVEMSYEYATLLPQKDEAYRDYREFVNIFGEEGNLIILGVEDPGFFDPLHFKRWQELVTRVAAVDGVENVVSLSNTYDLIRDTVSRKFVARRIFPEELESPGQLDSLASRFRELPFYNNLVYNDSTHTYLIAITVNKDKMRNNRREAIVRSIQRHGSNFEKESRLDLHYSGLPYIRVVTSMKIKKEIYFFSLLALGVCVVFLFFFFRSFKAVLVPLVIVLILVFLIFIFIILILILLLIILVLILLFLFFLLLFQ